MQAFEDYKKVRDTIKSCNNEDQLRVGVKLYNLLDKKYSDIIPPQYFEILENIIGLMRMKCLTEKDSIDERSIVGDEFRQAAMSSGVDELKKEVWVEDENVLKEINIGTQIEKNHLSDEEASDLATKNIEEIPDYYTNPDYCIIAIENKSGNKKTIRVETEKYKNSLEDEKLIMDDIEIFHENLEMDDIPHSLSKQLNKTPSNQYSKSEINKEIKRRRKIELDRRDKENEDWASLWDEDEIEESTGSGSAGQYTGKLFSGEDNDDVIRKKFYDVPETTNGIVGNKQTGLPISKVFAYKGKQNENEILEEDELEEATSYADAVGAYDTPGFPPSEFMGTAGKKGKAPVNKGITHTKLAYPGGDFVKIKNKCARYPYCNQSPEAIKISKKPFKDAFYENKIIKKGKLKIKK